jgi:Phycobilisome degradation protein nblA
VQFVKLLLSFVIKVATDRLAHSPAGIKRSLLRPLTLTFVKSELVMNQPIELSLEQQFSIRSFETQVQNMSHEQAQNFLVQLYKQMMMREATYKHLLKHQWGLEPSPRFE